MWRERRDKWRRKEGWKEAKQEGGNTRALVITELR